MIPASWPFSNETYEAFTAIRQGGFTVYCFGDKHNPHVLVAVYDWGEHVDIVNIRGMDRVAAARLPKYEDLDIFAPRQAVWHYLGDLEPAVAAVLRLPRPDDPNAPTAVYPAPLTLFVPGCERGTVAVRVGRG